MDTVEQNQFFSDLVDEGIAKSVALGRLVLVDVGYCFQCGLQQSVYDVSAEFPPQPPMCHDCLRENGIAVARRHPDLIAMMDGAEGSS
jgi:hypothetical protein